jgi:hypothetical protein
MTRLALCISSSSIYGGGGRVAVGGGWTQTPPIAPAGHFPRKQGKTNT